MDNVPERRHRAHIQRAGQAAVRLLLVDTGCGIAPENLTRIFSTASPQRKDGPRIWPP